MHIDLSSRVAVVTGASTGLGRAIAEALVRAGASVVGTGRRPIVPNFAWRVCDVRNAEEVTATIDEVVAEYGRLDILVNNAGISATESSSLEISTEGWNDLVATNLNGTWFGCRAAIGHMLDQAMGGTIVNISSRMALSAGGPGRAAYAASKAAVSNLTRQLAVEYGRRGIRINAVLPGFVPYTAGATNNDPARIQIAHEQTPSPRLGLPDDIANAVLFLASDAAAYINGHNLVVDGGASARS